MKASFAKTYGGSYMRKIMIDAAQAEADREFEMRSRSEEAADIWYLGRVDWPKQDEESSSLVHPAYDVFMQWRRLRAIEERERRLMQALVAVAGKEDTEVKRQAVIDRWIKKSVGEPRRREMMDYFLRLPKPEYWIDFETDVTGEDDEESEIERQKQIVKEFLLRNRERLTKRDGIESLLQHSYAWRD